MADSSANSAPTISLPKGGGALQGIGEKFAPDLHTGTGNFTIPIAIPRGRNGFQPQLSLVYSTGNGNGLFGLGWNLGLPSITRRTARGVPRYDDKNDVFLLSGTEDLVPVAEPDSQTTRYQPRTEGLFARILHHNAPQGKGNYWEVRSKDGLVSLYGTPRPSPLPSGWRDPGVVRDPDPLRQHHIFAWKLTQTRDPFGNLIQYEYTERDAGESGPHHWEQPLLSAIRYVDYGAAGNPQFLVSIEFTYEERSNDPLSEYRAGFEIRSAKRCTAITVRAHAQPEYTVRRYRFEYQSDPHNGVSLLHRVQVVGYDDAGNASEDLPPLEFGYSRFEPERRTFIPLNGADLPPHSLGHPDYELVDLFGNGLPDVLEMSDTVRYWRNLGEGTFDRPKEMPEAPAGIRLAEAGVQLVDANGDGRSDLLVTTAIQSGYFPLTFSGVWDQKSFQPYAAAPSFSLEDPEVKLVDLDGDGVTDAIRSGTRLECFFNDPDEGWNGRTRWVERRQLEEFPDVNFSDPRVRWADMVGDGLQDIVLVYDGNLEYWPNRGHGDWGARVHMERGPRFPLGYDPKRILLGDVDGDGLADLIYVDHRRVLLWLNQSGNGWSADPIEITGTPSVADQDSVRLVDLLGTGVAGVLWSAEATGITGTRAFFLDFTGGAKPYLLTRMDNHLGAVTKVEYTPSTRFFLEDQKSIPTRWRTPLPFPVQVLSRVEVIDALSKGKLTSEYRYHHGYWDGAEREFRGFGMVEQLDTETFAAFNRPGLHGQDAEFTRVETQFSPPLLTKTWFHQGAVGEESGDWQELDWDDEYWSGDPQRVGHTAGVNRFLASLPRRRVRRDALRTLRGSVLRTELYALDGTARQDRPYTVTEQVYGLREESPPPISDVARSHIFFPHLLVQRTTQWERGTDPMTRFAITGDYDAYGQSRSQISIAVPRGRDYGNAIPAGPPEPEKYPATHTVTDYAQRDDASRYFVNRVKRTTIYEIPNDGRDDLFSLKRKVENGTLATPNNVIGQTLNFYDGPAFVGLAYGQLGDYGALVRSESLVLNEAVLAKAYPTQRPPYLDPAGPTWTSEYPEDFRTRLPAVAGYVHHNGVSEPAYAAGYYVATERRKYDFHQSIGGRGLIEAQRDPLGGDTLIAYDEPYQLLPAQVIDGVGLQTLATYDYRGFQASVVTDPNGNQTRYTYSRLGFLTEIWVQGKTAQEGDQQRASTRMEYNLAPLAPGGSPISVRTIRQIHHDTETDVVPSTLRNATIETLEYYDGFGRLLQTRTQAEDLMFADSSLPPAGRDLTFGNSVVPRTQSEAGGDAIGYVAADPINAPRVAVSGWNIYDNKGRVVYKFEPFLDEGWDYKEPGSPQLGRKAVMIYDPRGQVIRTVNPDGSEQRVILGIPAALEQPDDFAPTPWEVYTYDANDNAGRTHGAAAQAFRHHWNTPSSTAVDALGRTVLTVERNRAAPSTTIPDPPIEEYRTTSTYDIQGNLLTLSDALGRLAFQHAYDLAKRSLRVESIDGGARWTVFDAVGAAVEQRDKRGALALHLHDRLHRRSRMWARDSATEAVTLREILEYGDGGAPGQAATERSAGRVANLLAKLYRHYDEAGLLTFESYDFKGNVLEKVRRVVRDNRILLGVTAAGTANGWKITPFRMNWKPPAGTTFASHSAALLQPAPAEYRSSPKYDALNRVKRMLYPRAADGSRRELVPGYSRAGSLDRVALDGVVLVEQIGYNAKGQRTIIAYGNGILTRYGYDPETFRLVRMRTQQFSRPATGGFRPTGTALQDLAYSYDLAGNILQIREQTPDCGIPNTPLGPHVLQRVFTYDPLYRLLSATGRECDLPAWPDPWNPGPRCQDPAQVRSYTERYEYDRGGNLMRLTHQAPGGSYNRVSSLVTDLVTTQPLSNRIASLQFSPATTFAYDYDPAGHLIRETLSRHFEWDHADRMRAFRNQAPGGPASVYGQYLYDAAGQRVMKVVRRQAGDYEAIVYVDGVFEERRWNQGTTQPKKNTRLHVLDDQSRIAMWRVGDSDDARPDILYCLDDHTGSATVVVDAGGDLVNREEFLPHGETSFGSFAEKRYRYTGKERDEESGLYYYGFRYYAPWLMRWMSCDPAGTLDTVNLYTAFRNNPIKYVDRRGDATGDAGAPSGGIPVNATDATGTVQRPTITYEPDEGGGYREVISFPTDPSSQESTPSVNPPRPQLGDAGLGQTKAQVRWQLDSTKGSVQDPKPDAGQSTANYTVGIAINLSSTRKGMVDVNGNPGHTLVYVQKPDGGMDVLSFGPSKQIRDGWTQYEFLQEKLPATPEYHLKSTDPYSLYTWSVTEAQATGVETFIYNIKADAGIYTMDRQCTSVAIEAARTGGLSVPSGIGKLFIPAYPGTPKASTPYHLDKELQESGHMPTTVDPKTFRPYLDVD